MSRMFGRNSRFAAPLALTNVFGLTLALMLAFGTGSSLANVSVSEVSHIMSGTSTRVTYDQACNDTSEHFQVADGYYEEHSFGTLGFNFPLASLTSSVTGSESNPTARLSR